MLINCYNYNNMTDIVERMHGWMNQGFVVMGLGYYLQAWCVEMKGPVFLAAWTPFCFIFTMFCSSFLGEIVHLDWASIFE